MNNPSNQPSANAVLLRLPHIAAWQIAQSPATPGPEPSTITAALPAMQRGAVWKPRQVEMLWDSIVRGFPVGAFLLSPFDKKRGVQVAKFEQGAVPTPNYHLLDGQQRANAITLGFLNPWGTAVASDAQESVNKLVSAVLWVDLGAPDEKSDAEYVFRVVTRSHPWGYRRANPDETLTVKVIRQALDEGFRKASPDYKDTPPHEIPLTHVWPQDALAPIPLVFLIEALAQAAGETRLESATTGVLQRLKRLPFWSSNNGIWKDVRVRLETALLDTNADLHPRWIGLVERLSDTTTLAANYGIPVLILPQTARPDTGLSVDPLESLFIRVNQAGTRLEGEELIYSILKSNWVEAPHFIERLSARLTHPQRLVVLASRLVLARMPGADTSRPPAAPDVAQFRRLVQVKDENRDNFRARLEEFVKGPARAVFEDARAILTDASLAGGDYALPPVLAFEIAHKTPDLAFLLLAWVMRMHEVGAVPRQISARQRRQILGFMTALSWFAPDPAKAVSAIWKTLISATPEELPGFFARPVFEKALRLGKDDRLIACPLPTPDVLDKIIVDRVIKPRHADYAGFSDPDSSFWKNWSWYEWLQRSHPKVLSEWFSQHVDPTWGERDENEEGESLDWVGKRDEAWRHFSNALWEKRSLLLFVQRGWLNRWFPDYDPTVPDQVEDKNRPWDFDHIHPQRYLVNESGSNLRKIPQIVWDWHGSIGNLRAWPLEANRADGDTSPKKKLSEVSDQERRYQMSSSPDECKASFVGHKGTEEWDDWCESVPEAVERGEQRVRYLALGEDGGAARQALIRAITARFSKLYRHWYEALMIGDLMP